VLRGSNGVEMSSAFIAYPGIVIDTSPPTCSLGIGEAQGTGTDAVLTYVALDGTGVEANAIASKQNDIDV